mmetsp:Transcript_9861/g.12357  ORF Transcript_9861/g.12357 Transcript_9861/m.12357 type:complete len:261 (+) Transcript_9861:51-833(+)
METQSDILPSVAKTIQETLKKKIQYKQMIAGTHLQIKLLAEFIATGDHSFNENVSSNYLKRLERLNENQAKIDCRADVFVGYLEENRNSLGNRKRVLEGNAETAGEVEDEMIRGVKEQLQKYLAKGGHKKLKTYTQVKKIIEKEDEDEEIALVNEAASHQLTCPITATLFSKPMKSKVCGHIFEAAAIKNHIRIKGRSARGGPKMAQCPVSGCNNVKLTADELEPDQETVLLVQRHKRELEMQMQSQVDDEMAEDLTTML